MAQSTGIKGRLVDKNSGKPVEFASVSVFDNTWEQLITGGLTADDGTFNIPLGPGNYNMRIQFMGYKTVNLEKIQVKKEYAELGKVFTEEDEKLLEEVIVQAERTQMELTLDKKVFNIGQDLSNLGGNATDILDNLPSVQVDVDGNVSLRGSDNVRILIDGKPSGLVGLNSTDALRQINGNLIDRVEVITNPSARYDAEGLAGIINIILKKEKSKGLNGSFQLNAGVPANHGASVNMNFRRNWINWFTNLGINYRDFPGQGSSYQEFYAYDSSLNTYDTTITNRFREHNRASIGYNYRFGADFLLNNQNSLTLSFLYRYSDEENKTSITYYDAYPEEIDSVSLRNDDEGEGDENLEYSLNYTRNFHKEGQKLTADIQFQNNNEQERNDLVQSSGLSINEQSPFLFQKAINDEIEDRLMLQSDYIHPYAKEGKFEGGFRYTDRLVGNNYVVRELNDQGVYEVDSAFSNEFEYHEKVMALYGLVSNRFNKISWQLGMRYEHTDLLTNQKTQALENTQKYGNIFPSAFFTYQMTPTQAFQASYSRRISRPSGRNLNPFSSISDNRNFWIGNPSLGPEYTDSYELGYLLNGENSSFYTGLYYRYTQGMVQRLRFTEGQVTTTRPYNVAEEDSWGIEINLSQDITRWYRVNGNVNFFHSYIPSGQVDFGEEVINYQEARATSLTTRISNNFKFGDLLDGQINIDYRAPRNTVQGKTLSLTVVDIGLSRDILNNKGTLSLSIRDLFNSRKWRSETFNETSYQESEFQWRSRSAQISFTYRLNQKKERGRGENGGFEGGGEF